MRFKLFLVAATCAIFAACSDDYDDTDLRDQLSDLDARVTSLEQRCQEMNATISSIQTLLNASQQQDYITAVTPIVEDRLTIGYTISFANNAPVEIYHGKDGATPQLSVATDTDGLYYWRLNGEWLTDDSGNKLPVSGQNGTTPQFKIEDGKWFVSYDDGQNWTEMGPATGQSGVMPRFDIMNGKWFVS